jgi:CrcB protein
LTKYLLVGLGGFFGAILRFWLGGIVYERTGTRFPYGTFVVNLTGCFLIGLIMTVITERAHLHPNWRYAVPIGFVGAYTTFSTFEYETMMAIQSGSWLAGLLNVTASVVLGFVCVWLGMILGRSLG